MKPSKLILFLLVLISCNALFSCADDEPVVKRTVIKRQQPKNISYHIDTARKWMKEHRKHKSSLQIVLAVNRTDSINLAQMDSIVVPGDLTGNVAYYLPFPLEVPYLLEVDKIIFFSYTTQSFAAYENGSLVYTGPVNMGRKKDTTPTGLFYTNWKAEETTSTFNDEWDLKWNFNIENMKGIGWHQYSLPGYPASHSCLRLQEIDAKFLYNWANEWVVDKKDSVLVQGTPVIIFGMYNFDAPKPWLQLVNNAKALDIPVEEIQKNTAAHLETILVQQQKRNALPAEKK